MVDHLLTSPAVLSLIGAFVLSHLPTLLRKFEVMTLRKLFAQGDAIDQKAIKATAVAWVIWAEEKFAPTAGVGEHKFYLVDKALARALPFLSADEREKLIEDVVSQLDAGAREATS